MSFVYAGRCRTCFMFSISGTLSLNFKRNGTKLMTPMVVIR